MSEVTTEINIDEIDDVVGVEGGFSSPETFQDELEAQQERFEETQREFEKVEEEQEENFGGQVSHASYDKESGAIYLDGFELQGDDYNLIHEIKMRFEEGREGYAGFSTGEFEGVTYQTDYYIEGLALRIETYVIDVKEEEQEEEEIPDTNETAEEASMGGGDESDRPAEFILFEPQVNESETAEQQEWFASSTGEISDDTGTPDTQDVNAENAWSSWIAEAEPISENIEVSAAAEIAAVEQASPVFDAIFGIEAAPPATELEADEVAYAQEIAHPIEAVSQPEAHEEKAEIIDLPKEIVRDEDAENQPQEEVTEPEAEIKVIEKVKGQEKTVAQTDRKSEKRTEEPQAIKLKVAEEKPEAVAETHVVEQIKEEPVEGEKTATAPVEIQKVEPIKIRTGVTEEQHVAWVPELESEEQEILMDRIAVPTEVEQIIEPEASTTVETIAAESDIETQPESTEKLENKKEDISVEEPAKTVLKEIEIKQVETSQVELKQVEAVREVVKNETRQIEKKTAEVKQAIKLVQAEQKRLERSITEQKQRDEVYQPVREIKRIVQTGPRFETGGISLRQNRTVLSNEERDRLERSERIVQISRNAVRRPVTNRSPIRLAA